MISFENITNTEASDWQNRVFDQNSLKKYYITAIVAAKHKIYFKSSIYGIIYTNFRYMVAEILQEGNIETIDIAKAVSIETFFNIDHDYKVFISKLVNPSLAEELVKMPLDIKFYFTTDKEYI